MDSRKIKEYELLSIKQDPLYADQLRATEIVKDFIIKNNLINYGGTAIDYAMRLKGSKLYSDEMLAIPDLDFYSPENVKHAYDLADILYEAGFKEARAINAMHTKTMKVDIKNNHWIADISFVPKSIFDVIPTIEYAGMKCAHPNYQHIDQHSALAFPFDDPPFEAIFNRWAKDITRFNLLAELYPITCNDKPAKTQLLTFPITMKGYVLTSFAAYALIYNEFIRLVPKCKLTIIPAKFTVTDKSLSYESPTFVDRLEIVNHNASKCIVQMKLENIVEYEPYMEIIMPRYEGQRSENRYIVYDSGTRLVGYNSVTVGSAPPDGKIGEMKFRITNIQYLLKHFLAMSFLTTGQQSNTYKLYYISLLNMIATYEETLLTDEDAPKKMADSIFYPSIKTYGNLNISISREKMLSIMHSELDGSPQMQVPRNHYPDRNAATGRPRPTIDMSMPFFNVSGLQKTSE